MVADNDRVDESLLLKGVTVAPFWGDDERREAAVVAAVVRSGFVASDMSEDVVTS